jgi:type VI secretion system (T6SS) phospholipase Tle1-like effector
LFIVGFSRGAATARMLANMISSTAGLPASVAIEYLKLFIEKDVVIGLNPKVPRKWGVPEVEFLGVWDTVAAFGNLWNRVELFKDLTLVPGIRKAYHLVAIDERRKTFDVTLLDPDERVEQIWFAGAHANVGGGLEKENSALSDIALRFMINRASEHGLRFKKEAFDIRGNAGGTIWQAARFWKWKIERKLGGDTRQLPRIHKSVFQRMQSVTNYESANVKELGDAFQRDERD